jgi:hypothetical protein
MGVTLGAYRRAKNMTWVPGAVIEAWQACARQECATGVPWPHAFFITVIGSGVAEGGSIHCEGCRAELALKRAEPKPSTAAPAVAPRGATAQTFTPTNEEPF